MTTAKSLAKNRLDHNYSQLPSPPVSRAECGNLCLNLIKKKMVKRSIFHMRSGQGGREGKDVKLNHGDISLQRARLHRTGKSRQLQPKKWVTKLRWLWNSNVELQAGKIWWKGGRYSPARRFRRKEPGSRGWNRQVGAEPRAWPSPRGASQEPGVGVGRLLRGREGVAVSS